MSTKSWIKWLLAFFLSLGLIACQPLKEEAQKPAPEKTEHTKDNKDLSKDNQLLDLNLSENIPDFPLRVATFAFLWSGKERQLLVSKQFGTLADDTTPEDMVKELEGYKDEIQKELANMGLKDEGLRTSAYQNILDDPKVEDDGKTITITAEGHTFKFTYVAKRKVKDERGIIYNVTKVKDLY